MSEQAWNFIKKETPTQVFSCDFYKIFLEHLFYRTFPGTWSIALAWITNFFSFSFFELTHCLFDSYKVLYFKFVDWISCHLVFLFGLINWCKKEKKRENASECFTHGLGKTLRVFNQVLSKMSSATKLILSSTILQ